MQWNIIQRLRALPVDRTENYRKGALVHAGITLARLDHTNDEEEFRQSCLAAWSANQLKEMKLYIISSNDASHSANEQAILRAAIPDYERTSWDRHKEGGLVHAALTVARLMGAGINDVAREIRQRAALIWHDEYVHKILVFVKGRHEELSASELRRYDRLMAGELQADEEEGDAGGLGVKARVAENI